MGCIGKLVALTAAEEDADGDGGVNGRLGNSESPAGDEQAAARNTTTNIVLAPATLSHASGRILQRCGDI
jgi:hypothetical protein